LCTGASRFVSLDPRAAPCRIDARSMPTIQRFQEIIAGRVYHIEAAAIRDDRWRAQIVRRPGLPTALMPFYGRTPQEAAGLLREWLARAHGSAARAV
jgi:hypothetical protein